MLISSRLASHFSPKIQSRGRDYVSRKQVQIVHLSNTEVDALVYGSAEYDVSMAYQGGVLDVDCTCPYFLDCGECKHLWATLLLAERKGFLSELDPLAPISIRWMDEKSEEDV